MLSEKNKILFLTGLLLVCFFTISAQEVKPNQLIISESDTLNLDDVYPDWEEDDDDEMEDDQNDNQTMVFTYHKWMPGYGLYSNFDVLKIHYAHDHSIEPDTLVLGNYVHPANYKAVSTYGAKRRKGRVHHGVDISFSTGAPIVAAFKGIVRIATYNSSYGNVVVIRHNNGLETYYAHLSKLFVNPGQIVEAGDEIGLGGSTGRSKGPHLHFETRYLGQHFNPAKIIDFQEFKLTSETLFVGGRVFKTNNDMVKKNTSSGQYVQTTGTSTVYVTIRKGDTLGSLAKKHKTTVERIKKLNNMKGDFLREGQRLRVR
jgi:hypothetical protein